MRGRGNNHLRLRVLPGRDGSPAKTDRYALGPKSLALENLAQLGSGKQRKEHGPDDG
jgi:hypothetical protein